MRGTATYHARGAKSPGRRWKGRERRERGGEDKVQVQRRTTLGGQSHQAGGGKEEKEGREEARTRYSGRTTLGGQSHQAGGGERRRGQGRERGGREEARTRWERKGKTEPSPGGEERRERGRHIRFGVPRSGGKVTRQEVERKRKKGERRRGQGQRGTAGYHARGAKSPGRRWKGRERRERGGEDKVSGVQRGTTLGGQSHQAGGGKEEKEGREEARTRFRGYSDVPRSGGKVTRQRILGGIISRRLEEGQGGFGIEGGGGTSRNG